MEARIIRLFFIFMLAISSSGNTQNFVRITDSNHPLSQTNLLDYWTGTAWVDVDNDDDLDLFLTNRQPGTTPKKNKLFLNEEGNFIQLDTGILVNDSGYWFGCSWGDYDNDGDLDAHVAGFPARLYRNDGNLHFTKITTGAIAQNALSGISTAWGDFNRDGYLDLFTVWPNWMPGPPWLNGPAAPVLMINNGPPDFTFSRLINTPITEPLNETYLHSTLSDFDDDGDLDIFIGMGAGTKKPDLLYRNLLSETGNLAFEKMMDVLIATDSVEGNQWSWIDLDNDGDLDGFLTNWANVVDNVQTPQINNLYFNQEGIFVKSTSDVIATDTDLSTSNTWGDYDNDGDLDCIVVTDSNYYLRYYQNDGLGNFERINAGQLGTTDLHQSGCSNGDFDQDGDLDLFIPGPGRHNAFFRNDLDNGNHWALFKLVGTQSNHSGIGAKLFVKANIGGQTLWQQREVSASNTFFGHNSLWQHFGLGDADLIDSLKIEWPSGTVDHYVFLGADEFYTLTEGEGVFPTNVDENSLVNRFLKVYPNPARDRITIEINTKISTDFEIRVIDSLTGREVLRMLEAPFESNDFRKELELKNTTGVYLVALLIDGKFKAMSKVVIN